MSCETPAGCGLAAPALGLTAPGPGQVPLRRRVGAYDGFAADLIARMERTPTADGPLGRLWDVEGDPRARLLVDLWAHVAEIVAAYSELTAGEAYLATAAEWTDLRRLASLVGYRPRPGVAAQGWVRFEVDRGADPVVPAGTRVQAPGAAGRPAQTFEVARETQLRSDWDRLTATWVPVSVRPTGRRVRFLGDPGFRAGDRVLFVEETPGGTCGDPPATGPAWNAVAWVQLWAWVLCMFGASARSGARAIAVAVVEAQHDELGTSVVEFDRDLDGVLVSETAPYAAYRVQEAAGQARRLGSVVRVTDSAVTAPSLASLYTGGIAAVEPAALVLDVVLDTLSQGQTVALVDWASRKCDLATVHAHEPVAWEVAPGTPTRASRLRFDPAAPPGALSAPSGPISAYVVDRRVLARHYEFPAVAEAATASQLRLYPKPRVAPERVAVRTRQGGREEWEVLTCRAAGPEEAEAGGALEGAPAGLIVDLLDGPPRGDLVQAPASANLARVRHGTSASAVLGRGDATRAGQELAVPDAPVAHDVDATGSVASSLEVRVGGIRWDEVPSLFGQGRAEVFTTRLGPDGDVTIRFGDGDQGARPPSGAQVTAAHRVGGGTAGELRSGLITGLLGSVRGVKKVEGAGPTTGGADQDDERRLRALTPARARAFGRAVSAGDLVDLAVGHPGVSHAVAWRGAGPPGCACGAAGLHLAAVRTGAAGPRAPEPTELAALAAFLDARRDATVPLCVCAGAVVLVRLTAQAAVDPRRVAADVAAAALAALVDPAGPLGPQRRALGQALDRSDVFAVLHGVAGVVGIPALDVPGASGALGRRVAARHELLLVDPASFVAGAAA